MDWDDLRFVLAVDRAGNYSHAAQVLKVAHTTVGRRIVALEHRLGVDLFRRMGNDLVATPACAPLLRAAQNMERDFLSAGVGIAAEDESPNGTVRITSVGWILYRVLAPALAEFRQRFPGVDLQLISDNKDRDFGAGRTNISLRFELPAHADEFAQPLASFPYALYARSGVDPATLPYVTFAEDFLNVAPSRWIAAMEPEPTIFLRSNDAGILAAALSAGAGKGLIPEFLGANDPSLVRLSGPRPEITRTLKAQIHSDIHSIAGLARIREWLSQVLSNAGGRASSG